MTLIFSGIQSPMSRTYTFDNVTVVSFILITAAITKEHQMQQQQQQLIHLASVNCNWVWLELAS